jgi:hypothetical protein
LINKQKIETIFRAAGMVPETRATIGGDEVFIGDGYSEFPHQNYKKFGVDPEEFPFGMYVTFWWIVKGEDKLDTGRPLFFDALKSESRDKHARLNAAIKDADLFIQRRKKARLDA